MSHSKLMLQASYLSLEELYEAYRAIAQHYPNYCRLEKIGNTRKNHPIYLLTLSDFQASTALESRSAFWLDAGTHAAEWAGVTSALYTISQWLKRISEKDEKLITWLKKHAVYCVPCLAPDGYEALYNGKPYLRSTLRDDRIDCESVGLVIQDIDGDGKARWMRWKHPAGPLVEDKDNPGLMRGRRIEDDPQDAYFMSMEGCFEHWDGWSWKQSPRHWIESLDLNRNFPVHWDNFQMFGMDGGLYPLSEVESRVVVDAFAQRPLISAALTNHTFTGALLTQPYRAKHNIPADDIQLMEALAKQCAEGTDYRVIRVHPDFTYDEDKAVVGVWSDTLSDTFGVPGYTLELWDPFKFCGVDNEHPALFFKNPKPEQLTKLVLGFKELPGLWSDWKAFEHPQLGQVELGGLDFMMSIRNPPPSELQEECERAYVVADRMRLSLPHVEVKVHTCVYHHDDHPSADQNLNCIQLHMENLGFLSTSALKKGTDWVGCPKVTASLEMSESLTLVQGPAFQSFEHLSGWGQASLGMGGLSPSLDASGHRALAQWWVRGKGKVVITWSGGRGGRGQIEVICH